MQPHYILAFQIPSISPETHVYLQKMNFLDIDKETVKQKLLTKDGVKLIDLPTSLKKQVLEKRIRTIEINGKMAPYLVCEGCDSIQVWYKYDLAKKSWVNQSGLKAMRNHLISCKKSESNVSMNVKKMIQSSESIAKRRCLEASSATNWKNFVVDTLAENPTVSISAYSRIVSKAANFSASITHSKGSLCDFSIGRTQLTGHLVKRGKESHTKLLSIFDSDKQRTDIGSTGIIDYWSARHTYLIPYGAVIVCGLDDDLLVQFSYKVRKFWKREERRLSYVQFCAEFGVW